MVGSYLPVGLRNGTVTMSGSLSASVSAPPLSVGACATLACIWEATAAKPGNVYRGADFEDMTYVDFLTSAAVIGPILEQVADLGVGKTILRAVTATREAVATNTNLGMLLLIVPLAAVSSDRRHADGIGELLLSLTPEDKQAVYRAIQVAQPGGLGKVDQADVHDCSADEVSLLEAMQLAAERDLVARQYTNQFQQVFLTADRLEGCFQQGLPLNESILHAYLQLLADFPDSLVVRKCGAELGYEVQLRAKAVLAAGEPATKNYRQATQDFDFWLRADGNRRNPGTSADLIAAAIFVLLREQRLSWPMNFYRTATES